MNVKISKSKMESPRWVTTNPFNEAFAKFRRLYNVHTVPVIFSTIPRFWCSIFWTAKRLNFCTVKVVSVNETPKRTMQIFVRCGMNYVYYVLSYYLVSLKLVVHFFTSAKPDTSQKNIFSVIQICWSPKFNRPAVWCSPTRPRVAVTGISDVLRSLSWLPLHSWASKP